MRWRCARTFSAAKGWSMGTGPASRIPPQAPRRSFSWISELRARRDDDPGAMPCLVSLRARVAARTFKAISPVWSSNHATLRRSLPSRTPRPPFPSGPPRRRRLRLAWARNSRASPSPLPPRLPGQAGRTNLRLSRHRPVWGLCGQGWPLETAEPGRCILPRRRGDSQHGRIVVKTRMSSCAQERRADIGGVERRAMDEPSQG